MKNDHRSSGQTPLSPFQHYVHQWLQGNLTERLPYLVFEPLMHIKICQSDQIWQAVLAFIP